MPRDEVRRLVLADRILFEAFAMPGRHALASVIANEMRNKLPEFDGVMYGSTKKAGAKNIAMRPASFIAKCQIIAGFSADACAIEVAGECLLEGIEHITAVDADRKFVWSGVMQSQTQIHTFDIPFVPHGLQTP
jgi:hypothetical protein